VKRFLVVNVLIVSFFITSIGSVQVRGDYISPDDSVTTYSINPELNLNSVIVGNSALYINYNLFRFEPDGDYCFVHLGTLNMPLQVIILETNQNRVECYLGGYVSGNKYVVDIIGQGIITCVANVMGVISFNFESTASPMAYPIVVSSRYDVNLDGIINVQDIGYVWNSKDNYTEICDVNDNGYINLQDLSYIWKNKDEY